LYLNLCKKVPGKKFLEKKPGNKNFGKMSEFSQVLGKNITGNKVLCFRFLGLFLGAANKVSGKKKINPRKRKT